MPTPNTLKAPRRPSSRLRPPSLTAPAPPPPPPPAPTPTVHNPKWRAGHPLQDCLTPAWVSGARWLLLDLAADRGDWGPALGGDGVVVDGWARFDRGLTGV